MISTPLFEKLSSIQDPIAETLVSIEWKDIKAYRFIDFGAVSDTISFISDKRVAELSPSQIKDDAQWTKFRQFIKIGRFVKAVYKSINKPIRDHDIEAFVNKFKACNTSNPFEGFEIVTGEMIRHWYNENNYYKVQKGTLWDSCMRFEECQEYFDIYMQNPEQVSLLILRAAKNPNRIKARALLWKNISINGEKENKYMDRIYTIFPEDTEKMKMWAKENSFHYRRKQDAEDFPDVVTPSNEILEKAKMKVKLDNGDFEYYPYMDTMKFLSGRYIKSSTKGGYDYKLDDTGGGYEDND
jgi:hypothetical protein